MALEIFSHAEKFFRITDSRSIFFVLNGSLGDFSDHSLYDCFAHMKKRLAEKRSVHGSQKDKSLQDFLNAPFQLPKGVKQFFEEAMMAEQEESDNIIPEYEKKLKKLKKDWNDVEEENSRINELLYQQYTTEGELKSKNVELGGQIVELKQKYQKIAKQLQDVNAQKDTFSVKELNRREKKREEQLDKMKEKYNVCLQGYKVILKDENKLEMEIKEKDKHLKKITNDLFEEMQEKRRFQKHFMLSFSFLNVYVMFR